MLKWNKIYFDNGLRHQCFDVEPLSLEQFDRSVAVIRDLFPQEFILRCKRIVASGCGDSFLAAISAKGAFERYLPEVAYEAPTGIETGRYLPFEDQEPDTLVVGISVSGGPARVKEILERGNKHGCATAALTDNPESPAAKTAKYFYYCNSPKGDNVAGLRTYYVSTVAMMILAAHFAGVRQGKDYLSELRGQIEAYRDAFFAKKEEMDNIAFDVANRWREKKFFEVVGDGPLYWAGRFISAKVVETSGDVCSVIDSENYMHVNGIMYPGENIGEMDLVCSYDENASRIIKTIDAQIEGHRDVLVFSDKTPKELGVQGECLYCPMLVPQKEWAFLLPLYAYIPASILAGYRSRTIGEPFFRGGVNIGAMTLGNNPIETP